MKDFNGFNFNEDSHRKRMKYIIITTGDLDINNAYSFKSISDLKKHFKDDYQKDNTLAVFEVFDVTKIFLNK